MRMDGSYGVDRDADFESHHIQGYAREGSNRPDGGFFKAPLISHVEGNLWQGGCIDGVELPDDFEYVVSLYPWEQYILGRKTARTEITMYDAGKMPDIPQLHEIAEYVNKCVAKGKTLVHCQAGLNRSGLVAALSLIKRGRTAEEAIALLQESRSPLVLCNRTFREWLLGLDVTAPAPVFDSRGML